MCNPRRVRVKATRTIAEAWRTEIHEAATARGDVNAEARLTQNIGDLLPARARQTFEKAMSESAEWTYSAGEYTQVVPGGTVTYRPDTGELEIAVQLSEAIEATGVATLVAEGTVEDQVVAEGVGTYYDDRWRGHTKELAEAEAKAEADKAAEEQARTRTEALKHRAEDAARHALASRRDDAMAEARRTAEQQLTTQARDRQASLDIEASEQLDKVRTQSLKGVFHLVASGYAAALQDYAAEYGENLEVSEEDGVISIQFEMEQ
jgi:hypothetical protein